MRERISRPAVLYAVIAASAISLAACATWIPDQIGSGILSGRVVVEWDRQDYFIYRKTATPLSFTPSFMRTPIVPEDMYTDGGSVPRIFWSIPGLSPWGLGPAYVIHDWIFEVHRCKRPAPPEVANITFEQSATILAEVGKALIEHGLIKDDKLDEIVWAVRTRIARDLWDKPGDKESCKRPPAARRFYRFEAAPRGKRVVDFVIPPKQRNR